MTSDQISVAICDKERAILEASNNLNTVQQRQYQLKKELLEVSELVRMGKHNLSVLRCEKNILEREYWQSK